MDASALERAISNLERSASSLEAWLTFWIALVVVGLAVEVFVVVKEWVDERRQFRSQVSPAPHKVGWDKLVLHLAGPILITGGVAGELFIHVQSGRVQTELRNANNKVVGLLQKQTSSANQRAGEAQLAAESLRNENLKLQDRLFSDRSLTKEQSARIAGKLKRFSGQKFELFAQKDAGALKFVNAVEDVLLLAGWVSAPATGGGVPRLDRPEIGEGTANGIMVIFAESKRDTLGPQSRALVAALNAEGVVSEAAVYPDSMIKENSKIEYVIVIVGRKP